MVRVVWQLALIGVLGIPSVASAQERQVRVSVTVPAPVAQCWALWTTDEGVRSFFAPSSRIDLRVDGAYEIFFFPTAPPGQRGADDMRLLAVEPNRRIAFTWNAPNTLPSIRAQRTVVSVEFAPETAASTRVTLRHFGWGSGPEWDDAIKYFETAWNGFVMPAFVHRVQHGPLDWKTLPALKPAQQAAIEHLVAVK